MRKTTMLRKLLERPEILVLHTAYDCITAKIIESLGFEAVDMVGWGYGIPDFGLVTMTEQVELARRIASSVKVPLTCDVDTGYGNAINVMRTVREFINAGAAGIRIEDQVFPKRCGAIAGKQVVPMEEMVRKIKAADMVRREMDPDFVIIARTDAEIIGTEEVIKRGNAYAKAGADVIGPTAHVPSPDAMELYLKKIDASLMAVELSKTGLPQEQLIPLLPVEKLQEMGFKIAIFPLQIMQVAIKAVMDLMKKVKIKGTQAYIDFEDRMLSFKELTTLLGFPEIIELEKKYLPKEELTKYGKKKISYEFG